MPKANGKKNNKDKIKNQRVLVLKIKGIRESLKKAVESAEEIEAEARKDYKKTLKE